MTVTTSATPRTTLTLGAALSAGCAGQLEDDPKVVLMGEDIGKLGGVFRITDALQKDFGPARVMDTHSPNPGSWNGLSGGAARGYRPVCEIQFDGFVYPRDQIVSQVAKIHYRTRGHVKAPLTIRIPYGGGIGAVEHHSESPEAYFAHTAGFASSAPPPGRRVRDDPAVDRARRPRRVPRTQAALLGPRPRGTSTPRRICRCTARGSPGPAPMSRSSRTARWCRPRCRPPRSPPTRAPRSRWSICARWRRSTSRPSRSRCSGPTARRRARGSRLRGPRRGDRGAGVRAVLLPARGAGAAGRRLRHPVPAAKLEHHHVPDADRILATVDEVLA